MLTLEYMISTNCNCC